MILLFDISNNYAYNIRNNKSIKMNLSELQTFLTIIETGSLVRASEKLNVTQSTVTARLKTLEDTLGQTLIIRSKSGAKLTPAGIRLKRYAQTITDLWRQARQETTLPQGVQTICNLGCHTDLWPSLGETLFTKLSREFPNIAFSIWNGNDADLKHWETNKLLDIMIGYQATKGTIQPLDDDILCLFSTRFDSPVRGDADYTFIESGDEFGLKHAADYADAGIARISFNSAQIGMDHILKNGGSAYLPKRLAAPYIECGSLFLLEKAPKYHRKVFFSTSQDSPFSLSELQNFL